MLFGREAEQSRIRALLADARSGSSGVLVVVGSAGTGKTALLDDAAVSVSDMQVLSARGIEAESALAFGALHKLLRPVMPWVERIPAAQASALRAAFGLEQAGGQDRFLVSVAVLSLLGEAAEQRPLLCLIDDAHWLDEASAASLGFVARRVAAEHVAMLFAARDESSPSVHLAGLPAAPISGLDRTAAGALLDRAQRRVAPEVRDVLVEATEGNPLALIELPTALTVEQLLGRRPLPRMLPMTRAVEQAFLDRVRRLSVDAQVALLVAAADGTGTVPVILAALTTLGVDERALDEAQHAELVRVRGDGLEFHHPLVRSAVYQAAMGSERRRVHEALATAFGADIDRRVWHRAASTIRPDAAVARDLTDAAVHAQTRGGYELASAAYERAAELSTASADRAHRLIAAAQNAWLAGGFTRAGALLEVARPLTEAGPERALIDQLKAWIELSFGSARLGWQLLRNAARDVGRSDPALALSLLCAATEAAWLGSDRVAVTDLGRLAGELPIRDDAHDRCRAAVVSGFAMEAAGDPSQGMRSLRSAITIAEHAGDPDLLLLAAHIASYVGDDAASYRLNSDIVAAARSAGAVGEVVFSLERLTRIDILSGRWVAAVASATEALGLARGTSQPALAAMPLAWLALLAAYRGSSDEVQELTAEVEKVAAASSLGIYQPAVDDIVRWARGVDALASGDAAHATTLLRDLSHRVILVMAGLDRVEAAVSSGTTRLATDWLRSLQDCAAQTNLAWAWARVAHCSALVAGGEAAEWQFQEALARHEEARRPFERARTELAYGAFLRRERRRVDARVHLRAALDVLTDLNAAPWAERARRELRASGQTARKRDEPGLQLLTPQEAQVARFVARGLPTREVAALLFLSPRTVDFHLRNVFAKLEIRSRTELALLPLE